MLSRRNFMAASCCLAATWPALGASRSPKFICTTPDVDDALSGHPHSGGARPLRHATLDPENLWTENDGATPGSGRITLNVCFVNGTRAERALVRRVVPIWTMGPLQKRISFRFDAPRKGSHIRVLFRGGKGNVSEVGRKNLNIPVRRETMNLDDVDQRGILHEFGHVLGLRHEHQHPASGIIWHKRVVIAALAKYGWSKAKVQANIFDHFDKNCACVGDPVPDPHSVMLYSFPPEWTRSGYSTPLNRTVSPRDRRCLERVYKA